MKRYLIPVFALAVAGYTTNPANQPALETETPTETGLVAIAMNSDDGFSELSFARIDPLTCHVTDTITYNEDNYPAGLSGDTHLVDSFEPGVWVVEGTAFINGRQKTITKFENHALAFRVEANKFIHVGKLELSIGASGISDTDQTALANYMAENGDEAATATSTSPWLTPFSHNSGAPVAGCNPLPANHV